MRVRPTIAGVALILAAGCVSVGNQERSSSTSDATGAPTPSPTVRAEAPSAFRADQPRVWKVDPGAWSVVLTWRRAPLFETDHYEITRDSPPVERDLRGTRFVDSDVMPETAYRYGVTAVNAAGARTDNASVGVETNAPPLKNARLEGRFAMRGCATATIDWTFAGFIQT